MKGRKPFIFDCIDRLFRSDGAIYLNKAEKKRFPLHAAANQSAFAYNKKGCRKCFSTA